MSWVAVTTDFGANTAHVVNVPANTIRYGPLATSAGPYAICIDPTASYAYVGCYYADCIDRIDLSTGAIVNGWATLPGGYSTEGIACSPDGSHIAVGYYTSSSQVAVVPTSTGIPAYVGLTTGQLERVAWESDTVFYAACSATTEIYKYTLSGSTWIVTTLAACSADVYSIAIRPDQSELAACLQTSAEAQTIVLPGGSVNAAVSLAADPFGVAITPDGTTAWFSGVTNGSIQSLSFSTGLPGSFVPVGGGSDFMTWIAVTPDGQSLYVADYSTGHVYPVTGITSSPSVGTPLAVGSTGVAISPDQAPTAAWSDTVTGLSVAFTDLSTTPVGTIAAWAWDFGDSNTSTAQNPTHVYAAGGTYTVTLTVTNSAGTSTTQTFTGQTVSNNGGSSATAPGSVTVSASGPTLGSWSKASQSNWSGQGPVV